MIDYRYPSKGYLEAISIKKGYDASALAGLIHELMNMRGVKVKSDYEGSRLKGYDVNLDLGDAINIKLSDHGAVTKLIISVFNEDNERDIFFEIWQNLTNAGYVSDEVFKRDLTAKSNKKDPKFETTQNDGGQDNAQIDSISASVEKDNEKKASEYSQVKKRHEYIWRIIKPVVERAGTYDEMRNSIKAKKQLGKNKGEQISVPNNATLKTIVEKYSKKQADTE